MLKSLNILGALLASVTILSRCDVKFEHPDPYQVYSDLLRATDAMNEPKRVVVAEKTRGHFGESIIYRVIDSLLGPALS